MSNGYVESAEVARYYGAIHSRLKQEALVANEQEPALYDLHNGLWTRETPYRHRRALELMSDYIELTADIPYQGKVLDAGCGSGKGVYRLAENNPDAQIVGLNICEDQIMYAQQLKREGLKSPHFCIGNYLNLPFPPGAFDRVLFVDSISHSPNLRHTLEEAQRVVSQDGKVIIFDYFTSSQSTQISEEIEMFRKLWLGPGIIDVQELNYLLGDIFPHYVKTDLTKNVIKSVRYLAEKILPRIDADEMTTGAHLLHQLMDKRQVKYLGIVATV